MNIANFFERKKRKLNSISLVDEAAAKKQHEKRLNDFVGLDKVDVFCVKNLLDYTNFFSLEEHEKRF